MGDPTRSEMVPITVTINQENAPQACLQHVSTEETAKGPFSQMTLVCVKLIKSKQNNSNNNKTKPPEKLARADR